MSWRDTIIITMYAKETYFLEIWPVDHNGGEKCQEKSKFLSRWGHYIENLSENQKLAYEFALPLQQKIE